MKIRVQAALLLALSGALPACIAFPFATPPLAISGGGGIRYNAPRSPSTGPAMVHVDVGMKPLQLMKEWAKRPADVGVGYAFEAGAGPRRHGAFFEGSVFPLVDGAARVSLTAQPRLWFEESTRSVGFGMAGRVGIEARSFVKRTFSGTSSSGGAFGYAHGEGGLGLYVEGAYTRFGDRPDVTLGLGLSARIPGSMGIAFAFLR
jgi:hypothetical protein